MAAAGASFDVVVSCEVIEHVADAAGFVGACATLLRPGAIVVFATLNRTAKAYLQAIVAAAYSLGWRPRGTHDWRRFLTPAELTRLAIDAGLRPIADAGLRHDPFTGDWRRTDDLSVNYMTTFATAEQP